MVASKGSPREEPDTVWTGTAVSYCLQSGKRETPERVLPARHRLTQSCKRWFAAAGTGGDGGSCGPAANLLRERTPEAASRRRSHPCRFIRAGSLQQRPAQQGRTRYQSAEPRIGPSLRRRTRRRRPACRQYRQLGQTVSPGLLLPALTAQTHTLRELSAHAGSQTRQGLLRLGSRYAEYVGWLVQETGNEQAALWWTQRAVDLAAVGGDHDLAAYGLVRRALVTLYREDATQTVELAQRAQNGKVPPRIRGLAAQREAQDHALAGESPRVRWRPWYAPALVEASFWIFMPRWSRFRTLSGSACPGCCVAAVGYARSPGTRR